MDFFQQKEADRLIPGIAGPIEIRVNGLPAHPVPRGVVVVCHPHPLYGGTFDNKVVSTVARACRDQGWIALRFNFRGVGRSGGLHDEGRGELEDLVTVMQWVRQQGVQTLALAGFSFGGAVAAAYARDHGDALSWLLLVSPALGRYGFALHETVHCPVWIVQGEQDEVLPPEAVYRWVEDHQRPTWRLARMADTGHFYHGKLPELKAAVMDSIEASSP